MALAPDDPARAKIAELAARDASREEVMEAMDTYMVPTHLIVKGLSPGHAREFVSTFVQHIIDTHADPGYLAISKIEEPQEMGWLTGPIFGGELDG